ncbi:MAG: PDZ domain-containing protein [Gammaproteobacteria bacterium]|nr:PDZ domain-containing protein [Gammaproteobacteria bacterium]
MIKTALIILFSLLSLWAVWSQFNDRERTFQLAPVSVPQTLRSTPDTAILNRLDSMESELFSTQNSLHALEQRLQQLEQKRDSVRPESALPTQSHIPDNPAHEPAADSDPDTLQDRLLSSGIPFDTVQRIQQQIGQNRLAQLQLRDQASRENWINTPEYYEKVQELSNPAQSLREELGDNVYDRYLFASGRPNRVIVSEVYAGSAAAVAGIKSRDVILSYASEHIYSMSDLQQATVKGHAGELVLIEIVRNDAPFTTSVPRGPLGISMTISRMPPQ